MLQRRPFLFIALLASLAAAPMASWAQVTTLPAAVAGAAVSRVEPHSRAAKAPGASSDLPLLALLGLGLLMTGAGMVSSIRPTKTRA